MRDVREKFVKTLLITTQQHQQPDQKKNHLMLELMKVIAGHMWMSVRERYCCALGDMDEKLFCLFLWGW